MSKRKEFSLSEKYDLLKQFDILPKCNQREAASKLGVTQSTLCRILKQRTKILEDFEVNKNPDRKRHRAGKAEDIEIALLEWFKTARLKKTPLSRQILILKAEEFAMRFGMYEFTATDGWFTRWKDRNNINYSKQYDEKDTADRVLQDFLPDQLCNFSENQIFNMDETALYYRALPEHTLMLEEDLPSEGKKIKARITVLLVCNMNGMVKRKPLVIGNSRNPYCLKGVKNLPIEYLSNTKAWMTSDIFTTYMKRWDQELGSEKIAVLLRNRTAHPNLKLKNIELFFLPPNTSFIQPLDQGIIRTFKVLYRSDIKMKIIEAIEDSTKSNASDIAKSITLLDAFHMIVNSWENISEKIILNCFKKSGIKPLQPSDTVKDVLIEEEYTQEFLQWVDIDSNQPTSAEQSEEDIVLSIKKVDERVGEPTVEEEVGNESELSPPTSMESRQALRILRRTLEQRGASADDYRIYYNIENRMCDLLNSSVKDNHVYKSNNKLYMY